MTAHRLTDDRIDVSPDLAHGLIAAQFPDWTRLQIHVAEPPGWDNRTFRLGPDLKIRLPRAARYAAQVEKEHRWLPRLAPHLPLAIPEPLAMGAPGAGYPWPWSVQRWIRGEPATTAAIPDRPRFAADLAGFLRALQRIDAADGPRAGAHSFHRGGSLAVYDPQIRGSIAAQAREIDAAAATALWDAALAAPWPGPDVWVHGDVAPGNLLIADGRLAAVIDFGCCAVGDPACDLAIAWSFFAGADRRAFRDAAAADRATWTRARGWALWKALLSLGGSPDDAPSRRVVADLLAEPPGA